MKIIQHENALDAIKAARAIAPSVVGYLPGGWFAYSPLNAPPDGTEPEFFIARNGVFPIPLTRKAHDVMVSIINSQLNKRRK